MIKLFYRMHQLTYRCAAYFLPWRIPEILDGENSLDRLPAIVKENDIENVLIITDRTIVSLGLMEGLLKGLDIEDIRYTVYDNTVPNPTINNVEEALKLYKENQCKGLIAFGGGSSIDCTKAVGARIARPDKTIPKMKGQLRVRKKIPPLFAIPTTGGTGSEATLAAVISNSETHEKYSINDHALIPPFAVHDPLLTVNLPPNITSTTGMDALTHAIEAYIGKSNTRETRRLSKEVVKLVFENLYEAYSNGSNLNARKNMLDAACKAGRAFTRAYVGNVHAIAHTLSGFYSVPHGLANAVILPYVLEYYGESIHKPLSELADSAGIGEPSDTMGQKAEKFIAAIKTLNENMDIPKKVSGINAKDIPIMVERALDEANPLYPVPQILLKKDMVYLYQMIME